MSWIASAAEPASRRSARRAAVGTAIGPAHPAATVSTALTSAPLAATSLAATALATTAFAATALASAAFASCRLYVLLITSPTSSLNPFQRVHSSPCAIASWAMADAAVLCHTCVICC